ncbi:hypothetical protein V8E54_013852 [Elaphomyces granulatus]
MDQPERPQQIASAASFAEFSTQLQAQQTQLSKLQAQSAQQIHYSIQQLDGLSNKLGQLETVDTPNIATTPPQPQLELLPWPNPYMDTAGTVPWKPADIGSFYSAMPCSWDTAEAVCTAPRVTQLYDDYDYGYTEDELPHEDNNSSDDPIGYNTEPISTSRVAESQNIIERQCIVLSAPWMPSLPCSRDNLIAHSREVMEVTEDPNCRKSPPITQSEPAVSYLDSSASSTKLPIPLIKSPPMVTKLHISYRTKVYFTNPCVVSLGIQADGLNLTTPKEKLRATADLEFPQQLETTSILPGGRYINTFRVNHQIGAYLPYQKYTLSLPRLCHRGFMVFFQ